MGNVRYLCNGQKEGCKKRTCYMNGDKSDHTCFWTRDVRYAKNFEKNKDVVAEDVYYEKRARSKFQLGGENYNMAQIVISAVIASAISFLILHWSDVEDIADDISTSLKKRKK